MPHSVHYIAEGPRVGIRNFTHSDSPEFTARVRESKSLHQPWLFPPDAADAYSCYVNSLHDAPTRYGFLVCERDTGAIAGFININNVVEGAFWSGALCYGAFVHAARRGLMREGLDLVIAHAFGTLGMHRLESNVQPADTEAIALARSVGFRLEGYSPRFLYVDGAWRDHQRWAITAEMNSR